MRERIINAVVTAVVHNKRSTIAGLVAVLGLVVAKLGLDVGDAVLLKVAGLLVLIVTAAAGDSHQKRRPAREIRIPNSATTLCLALFCTLLLTACPKVQTVRTVAAATSAACAEFKGEIGPELTHDEKAIVFPVVDEVEAAAEGVYALSLRWDRLGTAERVRLARFSAEQLSTAVERLSEQNIGIKSERGRQKLAAFLRQGRRAVSALRIIEATLKAQAEAEAR